MYLPALVPIIFLLFTTCLVSSSSFKTIITTNTVTVGCDSTSISPSNAVSTAYTSPTEIAMTSYSLPAPTMHGCPCDIDDNTPSTATYYAPAQPFTSGLPPAPSSLHATGPLYPISSGGGRGNYPSGPSAAISGYAAHSTGCDYGMSGSMYPTGSGYGFPRPSGYPYSSGYSMPGYPSLSGYSRSSGYSVPSGYSMPGYPSLSGNSRPSTYAVPTIVYSRPSGSGYGTKSTAITSMAGYAGVKETETAWALPKGVPTGLY